MAALFKKPKMPPPPKPVKIRYETDPEVEAAAQRQRNTVMRRRGRLSTILTEETGDIVGSSGRTLGA